MTSFRLRSGGLIDRSKPLSFSFDGKSMSGYSGDSLASALLANGRLLMGRSFKYHRPRGVIAAGSAEPNALMTIGEGGRTEPNTRATTQELYAGLVARSQNRWPSLDFDIGAFNGLLSPFLGAGFYYKTFMWPATFWEKVYEPFIRKAAGLGKASYEADPDRYEKCWAHCDLLVVGAGATGLAAALSAGRAGARVALVDEQSVLGGGLLSETATVDGLSAPDFARRTIDELASLPNVTLLPRTTAFGWYDGNVFGAVERVQKHVAIPDTNVPVERLWRIVAKHALLATGSEERPLVFGDNDIPGVMTAGAMRTFLNRYGVAPGQRVGVFTTNDSGYTLARDLETAGIDVVAVVDSRAAGASQPPCKLGARVIRGGVVTDARGGKSVTGMAVTQNGRSERLTVDALAMSNGFSPLIHLACQRGGRPQWSEGLGAFIVADARQGLQLAGAAAGIQGLSACLRDGASKAESIVEELNLSPAHIQFGTVEGDIVPTPARPLWTVPGVQHKAFVDYQNDVHLKDIKLAVREGYGHVELAKRYTTNGMATDQGKLSNVNAIGLIAEASGLSPSDIGTTTFRPFYTPVSFGALAGSSHGKHFQATRTSPLHTWAQRHGACFVEAGLWYRSSWFARPGELTWRESVDREVLNIRVNAGICDVSTLGKIEITGKDAAEFLNRVYSNGFAKLPVGKARYGLMLREDGFVYDDGTTSRLAEDRYFMTTTTGHSGGVMDHLDFCAQAIWPDLDVRLSSVTDQWAQMSIAGPKSRAVLESIVDDDISGEAFPHLGVMEVSLFGGALSGRLFRISFSGELAYELAVPAGYGESVADALMEAGAPHGICAYGVEALNVLRIEKGFVTHSEINGTVVPADLGMERMATAAKPDFIGKHLLSREGLVSADRLQLVGLVALDPEQSFRAGSHVLARDTAATLDNDQGHVTSMAYSPHVGATIGLALVKRGRERRGEEIVVWDGLHGKYVPARLCDPVFLDPANEKLK